MCGIAGIVNSSWSADEIAEKIVRMRSFLAHRGPDDAGLYTADGVGVVHTRLSIIDPENGQQPLVNEDQTVFLVANAEIYNYRELRRDLTVRGHRFRTDSDCESIVHLYEQYGEDCVGHLDGMFAFALWDSRQQTLLLARDRFGIKPLYLGWLKNGLCFASELTAITQSGLLEKQIDPQALYAYLAFSYVPAPQSIFRNVEKVRPSERVIFGNGRLQRNNYWQRGAMTVPRRKQDAIQELSWRLEESVRAHMVSDVPVAAFLSGGVDSSIVVALARKHAEIETFCASFPGTGVDEAPVARCVAKHLGTRHHEIAIEFDPARLVHEAVGFMDEPFADSSALPTYAVCRAVRQVAKVVLSGDGGDEVFGGYTGRYRVAGLKATLPYPSQLGRLLRRVPPWRNGKRSSTPEMLELAALSDSERYIIERQITTPVQRAALFGNSLAGLYEPRLRQVADHALAVNGSTHPVTKALWMDISTSLSDDMLTKVDRMSMAHGLEVRLPLLDHRLVEFVLSLPPGWLVGPLPTEGKRILRELVRPMLPEGILNRPKHGFVIPLNDWIRRFLGRMLTERIESGSSRISRYLDQQAIAELLNRPVGIQSREDLYALLILELWLERFEIDVSYA